MVLCGSSWLELYLKAALAKRDGSSALLEVNHGMFGVWKDLSISADFPFGVVLDPRLAKLSWGPLMHEQYHQFPLEVQKHIGVHRSLYKALSHATDLKYIGAGVPRTTVFKSGLSAEAYLIPDDYMIHVLARLRAWIAASPWNVEILDEFLSMYAVNNLIEAKLDDTSTAHFLYSALWNV